MDSFDFQLVLILLLLSTYLLGFGKYKKADYVGFNEEGPSII